MMQRELHKKWRLRIQAEANNFRFNLNASRTLSRFLRFSVELRLRPLAFKFNSEPETSFSRKRKAFKAKCLRIFQNLGLRLAKNKPVAAERRRSHVPILKWRANRGSVCASSILLGSLAHLCLSISKNGKNMIFLLGSFIFLYFAFLLKNYRRRRIVFNSFGALALVILGFWAILLLRNYFLGAYYSWKFFWRASNHATSLCFYNLIRGLGII